MKSIERHILSVLMVVMILNLNCHPTSGQTTVVVAKWLEQRSPNLDVPSSKPPGTRALLSFISSRVSLFTSLKRGASLLFFLFPTIIPQPMLPEAKHIED